MCSTSTIRNGPQRRKWICWESALSRRPNVRDRTSHGFVIPKPLIRKRSVNARRVQEISFR